MVGPAVQRFCEKAPLNAGFSAHWVRSENIPHDRNWRSKRDSNCHYAPPQYPGDLELVSRMHVLISVKRFRCVSRPGPERSFG